MKQLKNSNLLIVGYGSIGKKYSQSASKFLAKANSYFSKHLQKNNLEKYRSMKELNYIILSNRANERVNFKSLIKKEQLIFWRSLYLLKLLTNSKKNIFKYYKKKQN